MTGEELSNLLGRRVIVFHPEFAEIGGDACAGLFLSQALYWGRLGQHHPDGGQPSDGWFYHTLQEWHDETFIGRRDMDRVRTVWKDMGVLEERTTYMPTRLWYRVNLTMLAAIITDRAAQSVHSEQTDLYTVSSPSVRSVQPYTIQSVQQEHTPETTIPVSHAGAQASFVEQTTPLPTPPKAVSVPSARPTRQSRTQRNEDKTYAPTKYKVGDDMWAFAQHAGWRADREALQRAADRCFAHYRGDGRMFADWLAKLEEWISNDILEGRDLKMAQGGTNGRQGPGGVGPGRDGRPDTPKYGYNRAGEPTNRTTAIIETARELAASQSQRMAEEQPGEDNIRGGGGPRLLNGPDFDESDS
jgi:hypothetical protein